MHWVQHWVQLVFPMTYSHMVGRLVDIRRTVGRHSFITGVVSTIHCLSATVCVGGEATPTIHPCSLRKVEHVSVKRNGALDRVRHNEFGVLKYMSTMLTL